GGSLPAPGVLAHGHGLDPPLPGPVPDAGDDAEALRRRGLVDRRPVRLVPGLGVGDGAAEAKQRRRPAAGAEYEAGRRHPFMVASLGRAGSTTLNLDQRGGSLVQPPRSFLKAVAGAGLPTAPPPPRWRGANDRVRAAWPRVTTAAWSRSERSSGRALTTSGVSTSSAAATSARSAACASPLAAT